MLRCLPFTGVQPFKCQETLQTHTNYRYSSKQVCVRNKCVKQDMCLNVFFEHTVVGLFPNNAVYLPHTSADLVLRCGVNYVFVHLQFYLFVYLHMHSCLTHTYAGQLYIYINTYMIKYIYVSYVSLVAMGSSCMLMSCHRCCQGSFRYVQLAGWRNGSPQPSPRGLREGPGIEIQD